MTSVRRLTTVLVTAAVALIGVLATADALRDHEPETGPPPRAESTTTLALLPSLVEILRAEEVIGAMLYSDDRCRLHSLVLPELVDEPVRGEDAGPVVHCRFEAGGGHLLREGDHISPNNRFVARCTDGRIEVRELTSGIVRRRIEGCAPSWRPDFGHRLMWAREGTIYDEGEPSVTMADLRHAAHRHPTLHGIAPDIPVRVRVHDLAALDNGRLVASLEVNVPFVGDIYESVLWDGRAVIGVTSNFGGLVRDWVSSRSGGYAASANGTIMALDGETTDPPDGLPAGRAVAFSPDERWLAYVTGRNVYLIGTAANDEPGRVIRVPVPARDLVWQLS
jgi:hypothetical protein